MGVLRTPTTWSRRTWWYIILAYTSSSRILLYKEAEKSSEILVAI